MLGKVYPDAQTQLRSRSVCDNLDLRDAYPDTQTQLRFRFVCDNLDPERCIEKKLIWDQTSVTNRVSIKTKLMWKQKEKQILQYVLYTLIWF